MAKALYRKYRSKKLSEIVGQDHITTTLDKALKAGKISHAYLFTGPRGVGKTSIARILAHEINNLPYDEEKTHLDIIEIDAASNRRIDEIRELRDRVHTAPASAKFKIYIIDEVHMLTREAFNALLKTLEEPPAHVIFILATTEVHKLPETIVSRTQRFNFKPITKPSAVSHLKNIASSENIKISDEALDLLAIHGDGSFRDSISLLDQVANSEGQIGVKEVQLLLGIAPEQAIDELANALTSDPKTIIHILQTLRDQGFQSVQIARQLNALLRNRLVHDTSTMQPEKLRSLMTQLLEVPTSHDPDSLLEIILLTCSEKVPQAVKAKPESIKNPQEANKIASAVVSESVEAKETITAKPKRRESGIIDSQLWDETLQVLKSRHNTLYSLARMADPEFTANSITLQFSFPFHQKRLNEAKNKKILSDIIKDLSGKTVEIDCVVVAKTKPAKAEPAPKVSEDASLHNISNIFGGAEMLE